MIYIKCKMLYSAFKLCRTALKYETYFFFWVERPKINLKNIFIVNGMCNVSYEIEY